MQDTDSTSSYWSRQSKQNLGLGDGRELNLTGLMLFGQNPQRWRPAFEVKAVAYPGRASRMRMCS